MVKYNFNSNACTVLQQMILPGGEHQVDMLIIKMYISQNEQVLGGNITATSRPLVPRGTYLFHLERNHIGPTVEIRIQNAIRIHYVSKYADCKIHFLRS